MEMIKIGTHAREELGSWFGQKGRRLGIFSIFPACGPTLLFLLEELLFGRPVVFLLLSSHIAFSIHMTKHDQPISLYILI